MKFKLLSIVLFLGLVFLAGCGSSPSGDGAFIPKLSVAFEDLENGAEYSLPFWVKVKASGAERVDIEIANKKSGTTKVSQMLPAPDVPGLFVYKLVEPGIYTIHAIAKSKETSTSTPIYEIYFLPPEVRITAPSEGSVLKGEVTVEVEARDNVGIAWVALYDSNHQLGKLTDAIAGKFIFNVNTRELSNGEHELRAVAEDLSGNVSEASVRVIVDNTSPPPEVQIIAPNDGAALNGIATIEIEARDDEGIAWVALYDGGRLLEKLTEGVNGKYTFSVNTEALTDGEHELRAVAADLSGNASEASLRVVVDNTPPVVEWILPHEQERLRGVSLLKVNAEDPSGVARVEFYVDGQKLAVINEPPWEYSWDTTEWPDGEKALRAVSWDSLGNRAEVSLTLETHNDPEVTWVKVADANPVPGMRLAGNVELRARVDAPRGVERVEFYVSDTVSEVALGEGTLEGSDYVLNFSTYRFEPGDYTIKVRAYDSGNYFGEAELAVKFADPFVIINPKDGERIGTGAGRRIVSITVGLNGTLYGQIGEVAKVEVYINAAYQGEADQVEATSDLAFIYTWDTAVASPGHDPNASGDRIITAKVTLNSGETFLTPGVLVYYIP